jgi:hypothetical protein
VQRSIYFYREKKADWISSAENLAAAVTEESGKGEK